LLLAYTNRRKVENFRRLVWAP